MSAVCHYYNDCNQFEHVVSSYNVKIKLPKKQKIYKHTTPMAIHSNGSVAAASFEVNNRPACFDPTISNSPSNVFIHNLTNRMNEYYADMGFSTNNHTSSRRDRANSMEVFIRKQK